MAAAILKALQLAAAGDWHGSHNIVQDINSKAAAHIHAYLHRVEGDQWNADYWYRRAGEPSCHLSLEDELAILIERYGH